MFDEMPDQFYQFLAARSAGTTDANSLSNFSLHHHNHQGSAAFTPTFDPSSPYSLSPHPHQGFLPHTHLLHHTQLAPLHLHLKNEDKEEAVLTSEFDSVPVHHSWSSDEVIALLRIRSSLDNNNWFPDFIWENVSRKLAELGFKRSADKCKEKFEEETRISFSNNCRLFGELEDLCNNHHPQEEEEEEEEEDQEHVEKDTGNDKVIIVREEENSTKREIRKRKRHKKKFEMFKGFCENIVNKMISQQEELHCKILQDMVKRDEEKIAREEAWKKKQIERIQKEMEVRAHELSICQAKILSLFNNFTSSSLEYQSLIEAIDNLIKVQKYTSTSTTSSSIDLTQDSIVSTTQPTNSSSTTHDQNPSFLVTTSKFQNPNENNSFKLTDHTSTNAPADNLTEPEPKPGTESSTKEVDIGRRWPRDEVLALINIRCSLLNGDHDTSQMNSIITKGSIPLWERISQRMTEMGYNRNSKRCKEKWENINKYFRKTKDLNKKRSIDSRTCPYFHQLSHLYSQTQPQASTLLLGTSDPQVVSQLPPGSPENRPTAAQGGQA